MSPLKALLFLHLPFVATGVRYALTDTSSEVPLVANWFLSEDGTLLISSTEDYTGDCESKFCRGAYWTTVLPNSTIGTKNSIPPPSADSTVLFATKIYNNSACGGQVVDVPCIQRLGKDCLDSPTANQVPGVYPLTELPANGSCAMQLLGLSIPAPNLHLYMSPHSLYLLLLCEGCGREGEGMGGRLLQRFGGDPSSFFDLLPAFVFPGVNDDISAGRREWFGCEADSCLAWRVNDTALGWWVRDATTGTWALTAVLTIPTELLPPDVAPSLKIITYSVSYSGSGVDDDALILAIVSQEQQYAAYDGLVVWSSGVPGVHEGGKNDWRQWNATVIHEPYPEYFLPMASADWAGTSANGLRTFVTVWANATVLSLHNYSQPYSEIIVYEVAVNQSTASYGHPAIAQRIPCCPGRPLVNPNTSAVVSYQIVSYLNTASKGNRFVVGLVGNDPGAHTYFDLMPSYLFSDLEVYPPPSHAPASADFPAWVVPTALGTTGGLLAAGAVLGVLASRLRKPGATAGPTERTRLRDW